MAFNIPHVYDYMTKLRRTQAEVILSDVNPNGRGIKTIRGLNLAAVKPKADQLTTRSIGVIRGLNLVAAGLRPIS
jgi:hypothetical protein